jgi:protein TonB
VKPLSLGLAALLLALSAAAAPQPSTPLQCRDERGRPFPAASRPLRVGGNVTRPLAVHQEWPDWTKDPPRLRGVVLIESIIDQHGRVCAARLMKGSGPLAESTLAALKRWKFEPAKINGRPIPVYYTFLIRFCPQ